MKKEKNFEAFLPYLGDYYVELHKKIDLYSTVRSKFVHEFSLRPSYVIWVNEKTMNRKGIESMNNHLNFHIREYYRDFKKGIENYKKDLVNSNELFARFIHTLAIRDFSSTIKITEPKKVIAINNEGLARILTP